MQRHVTIPCLSADAIFSFTKLRWNIFKIIMLWKCGICELQEFLSLRELMQHINRQHGSMMPFHIFCGINNCPQGYSSYSAFYKHVRSKHSCLYESHMRLHRSRMSGVILIMVSTGLISQILYILIRFNEIYFLEWLPNIYFTYLFKIQPTILYFQTSSKRADKHPAIVQTVCTTTPVENIFPAHYGDMDLEQVCMCTRMHFNDKLYSLFHSWSNISFKENNWFFKFETSKYF